MSHTFFFINKFFKTYLLSCDDYVPVIKAGCDMSPSAHHDHFNASHAISIQLLSSKQTLSHHDHFIASHAISNLIMQVFGWVANWTMYIAKSLCNLTLQQEIKRFSSRPFHTNKKKFSCFPKLLLIWQRVATLKINLYPFSFLNRSKIKTLHLWLKYIKYYKTLK